MNRRQFLAATGVASVSTLAGCGGGGGTPTVAESDVAATVTIADDDSYDPPVVSIDEGEAVEWVNELDDEREIAANEEMDNSAEWTITLTVPPNGSVSHTFEESGVYSYHDREETWFFMCGAVAVGDASEEDVAGLPCE